MKKKIGFIDLFIENWHSNHYPAMIANSAWKDKFEVVYAWEERPLEGARPLGKWCEDMGITPSASIEEVVEKSDCICVLAPSAPEVHERLADIPLRSGKPLYIDKPFAESREAAERIFALAKKYNTPLMSSSALRYGDEFIAMQETFREKAVSAKVVATRGGGRSFPEYSIHQFEMIVTLLGTGAKNVIVTGNDKLLSGLVEYSDERSASFTYNPAGAFACFAQGEQVRLDASMMSHIFENLLDKMMGFFDTGISPIPMEETLEVASIREAAVKAMENTGVRVPVK
ncbi:MAG: Gfo/Idh/MocA family oxidoreductase [Lentisphaeria bacterium]|nr:Gfo/Idh/MocA family oxidoreductase [Lentisphaeria bacterium]